MRKRNSKRKMIAGLLALVMVFSVALGNITLKSLANANTEAFEPQVLNEETKSFLDGLGVHISVDVSQEEYANYKAANNDWFPNLYVGANPATSELRVYFATPDADGKATLREDGSVDELFPVSNYTVTATFNDDRYALAEARVNSLDAMNVAVVYDQANAGAYPLAATASESGALKTLKFDMSLLQTQVAEDTVVDWYAPLTFALGAYVAPVPAPESTGIETQNEIFEPQAIGASSYNLSLQTSGGNSFVYNTVVYYVDDKGNLIERTDLPAEGQTFTLSRNGSLSVTDLITSGIEKADGSKYQFCWAKITNKKPNENPLAESTGWKFTQIKRRNEDRNFRIDSNDGSVFSDRTRYVYLVYYKEIPTVETVDTKGKISIEMFDFGNNTSNGNDIFSSKIAHNYTSKATYNLVKRNLQNGVPVANNSNAALLDEFSANSTYSIGNANHLFLKDSFDSTGYYYYSSFENYAYWLGSKKGGGEDFKVYDALGTPSNDSNFYYRRGNFLAANDLDPSNVATHTNNQSSEDKTEMGSNSGKILYKVDKPVFHIGMHLQSEFMMPEDGKVTNPSTQSKDNMIFEFNGDDDMWVFIDGMLMLDIGGVHDAQGGTINFATGQITTSSGGHNPDTMVELYRRALEESGKKKPEIDKIIDDKFINISGVGTIFKNYTQHTIDVFYMERGWGASNLKIKFNIPVVDKSQINIKKSVEGLDMNKDFDFQLYLKTNESVSEEALTEKVEGYDRYIVRDSEVYELARNQAYTLDNDATILNTDVNTGIFSLKNNQEAHFAEMEPGQYYILREVNLNDGLFDFKEATINNEKTSYTLDAEGDYVQIDPHYIGENDYIQIVVKNKYDGETLKIEKAFDTTKGTQPNSDDIFYFRLYLGDEESTEYFQGNCTYNQKAGGTIQQVVGENGIISMKVGESVQITGFEPGAKYRVVECDEEGNPFIGNDVYGEPRYEDGLGVNKGKEPFVGTITTPEGNDNQKAKHNKVTVTNCAATPILGKLTIEKTIDKYETIDGNPTFTFRITQLEDKDGRTPEKPLVLYRYIKFADTKNRTEDWKKMVVIEDLPLGKYMVEEMDSLRYTMTSSSDHGAGKAKEIKDENGVTFSFKNEKTFEKYYSHDDYLKNKFTVNEDGSITISQEIEAGEEYEVEEGQ